MRSGSLRRRTANLSSSCLGDGLKAFKAVSKETSTQLIKIMYLTAVSSTGPIGNYEMDWSEHTKVIKTGARKGEVVAAKVDSEFLKPFWIKIHTAARRKWPRGPVFICLDRASAHRSKVTVEFLEDLGFTVISQTARSPDFNTLDAFVFPAMERECNKRGALTKAEIRVAVNAVWKKVTVAECKKAQERVIKNMKQPISMKGGNFYKEGAKK